MQRHPCPHPKPHPAVPFKRLVGNTLLATTLLGLSASAWSMDLLQAYEAARLQDATILASRAAAAAGRERLPQARAQLFPSLSANAQRNTNQLNSVSANIFGQEQTSDSNYRSANESITLRQPLFRTFLTAQLRQARAQVEDAEASLAQDEQTLASRVGGAYFEAMLTYDQLALVLAQRTTTTTQLDATRKAFAGGAGTRTDVDEAQARLDQTLALEIEARQNLDYTRRQLEVLVNQPIDKLATLNVSKLQLVNPEPNRIEDWTSRAELNSPLIRSLKAQLEAARQEIAKAQAGHHPTLDAVVQWTRSQSENVTNVQNRYTNTSMGLQLSIPIFQGGFVNSQVRQALALEERAGQALEAGRRDLAIRVYKEFRGVTESVPKIKALELALKSSEQLVTSNRKSFQAGSRTVVDVLNAEQQRTLVERDLAQARYVYLISRLRLLALTGEADTSAVATLNQVLQN